MRVLKQLAIPQNSDSKFPYGTIQNETDLVEGTPVVEQVYGDILTNLYKLMEASGVEANGEQDNDDTQYQLLEAIRKLPNVLNDVEQVLILESSVWKVPFNLAFLPNKYFFTARASEDYILGSAYTFKGLGVDEYPFVSSGFKSGDELLVIIDQSGVRAYFLGSLPGGSSASEIFAVIGTPLAFNDTSKLWYQESEQLISDVPSVHYLGNIIRDELSDGTVILNDVFVMNGYVLCFCLIPSTNNYFFRQFNLSDLSVSEAVTTSNGAFSTVTDNMPYVYAESGFIYVTNNMNGHADDNIISKLSYSPSTANLAFISNTVLDASFVKTSNAVVKSGLLYTMISGVLESYNLTSGAKLSLGTFSGVAGQLFGFNGQIYFNSGEVAKKWF